MTTGRAGDLGPAAANPYGFLQALTPAAAEAVLQVGRRRQMQRNDVLFREGDPAGHVFVVLSGIVKVWVTARSGRVVILDVCDAGELLCELAAIDNEPLSASGTALEAGEVLVIPLAPFRALLESEPGTAMVVLAGVARRLRVASQRQLEFGTNDSLSRLCGCLLDLGERYGRHVAGRLTVVPPMGQGDLASWTGLSREAVVKGLRSLRILGWIEGDGRRWTLLDPAALRDRADS